MAGTAPTPGTTPLLAGRVRRGYALGGVASGTFGTVPGLLLMPYLTEVVGICAALAGAVVFIPKAWDFLLNPVAGRISDRSTHPGGRRRAIIVRAGLAMAVGFALVFSGPTAPAGPATAWVVVAYLLAATAYAFFQVPYLAMSAEMTDDYCERTRLMTARVVVITLAILVSGGVAPLLVESLGGAAGYRLMALVMAATIALGTVGLWWGTRTVRLSALPSACGPLAQQLTLLLTQRHARTLLTTFVLQAVAMTMVLAGISYTARHVMGDATMATWVFVAFVAPAVVVSPGWGRIGVRWGKKNGLVASSLLLVVGLMVISGAREGNVTVLLVGAAVVGTGYAGAQLFPLAMLPDVAAHDARAHGVNRAGLLSGAWSGFELLGFATGPLLYGIVLTLGGYSPGALHQDPHTLDAILVGVTWVPALLVGLSLVPLSRYGLDRDLRAAAAHQSTST